MSGRFSWCWLGFKGTRISVDFVIELLENNWTFDDILKNYPQLEKEDILAAVRYVS
ncbi:DUF433 domain-containing protein [Methanohalophilus halophilus]|uniref:DUF433 domain-containing protein n=1 Tax=Methanohalophilus halophilus TaxID=2177 RepID=UPI001F166EBA|nr:DUF433 domain-containing protein [Methanohalophilus halophilus]